MLAGGSDVTPGTKSTKKDRRNIEIYNTHFISYLAKFLIVFDASAGDFWASKLATKGKTDPGVLKVLRLGCMTISAGRMVVILLCSSHQSWNF